MSSGTMASMGAGFGFKAASPPNVSSKMWFSGLNEYDAVGYLQRYMNTLVDATAGTPSPFVLAGGKLTVDRQYGGKTHSALKQLVDHFVRFGGCHGTSGRELDSGGPYAARPCLTNAYGDGGPLSEAQLGVIQGAWREWKDGTGDAAGGTPGPGPSSRTPADVVPYVAPPSDEGGFPWGVVAVLGIVGVGMYIMLAE